MILLDKLEAIKTKWEQLGSQLAEPAVISDRKNYARLSKEYKDIQKVVNAYGEYKNILSNIDNNKALLSQEKDEELRQMAKDELDALSQKKDSIEETIRRLLIPKDPEDSKNAVVEIRGGTGGDEASLFAGDLYKMYTRYCESKGWKYEHISAAPGTAGGFKEIIFSISGEDIFGTMKYESGVHRVQRVPKTETQGRIHTSAATVVVLPEAEEFDIKLNDADIRKDTYRASGAGGQHVNKTDSAVRLTHIPSGIVVECQDERSQMMNYEKALKVLRARIYESEMNKRNAETAARRKSMVSTGDRSAKIRTYNFPQGRVTDHRIGLTLYNLEGIMGGGIEELLQALQVADNAERLKESLK